MDPPFPFPLINQGSFTTSSPNPNPSMAEIWAYTENERESGMLGLRMGSGNGGFVNALALIDGLLSNDDVVNRDRDGSIDVEEQESTLTHQSAATTLSVSRKRTDNVSVSEEEDESSKANHLKGSNGKRIKPSASLNDTDNSKAAGDSTSAAAHKPSDKLTEPPKDYIHVRARRGQATDSHSLAERARREKISERTKILQDLVPGCNKVIGKALVLDEIINYIQSLQRQVEVSYICLNFHLRRAYGKKVSY